MKNGDEPIRNPFVVLREEFDDWAVLFDPDTGRGFGLNPTGVQIWKFLDGERSLDEIVRALHHAIEGAPAEITDHVRTFVSALVAEALAAEGRGQSSKKFYSDYVASGELKGFRYEAPRLVYLGGGQEALGVCSNHGSHGGSCYSSGAGATGQCWCTGTCGSAPSCAGCCDSSGCTPTSDTPDNCCASGGCPKGCQTGYTDHTGGAGYGSSVCFSGCSGSLASCTP